MKQKGINTTTPLSMRRWPLCAKKKAEPTLLRLGSATVFSDCGIEKQKPRFRKAGACEARLVRPRSETNRLRLQMLVTPKVIKCLARGVRGGRSTVKETSLLLRST